MEKIHILIADDIEAHRRRLERIISSENNFELMGSVGSGQEAVCMSLEKKPEIILMDIEMEDYMAGINASSEISSKLPDTKIIILTVHQDNNLVFAAFQTGIVDYVLKNAEKEEIIEAINCAITNTSPIRPVIASKIREEFARIKQLEANFSSIFKIISTLTPSELIVLKLLCNNYTRKEIAKVRCVEIDTIKKQVNSILKKFDKRNTREVVKLLGEHEVIDIINNMS